MRPTQTWRRTTLVATFVALSLTGIASGNDKKTNNNVESDVEFGIKMAQRGLWKEALFRFQQADLQHPNNGKLLNNMAVAYEAVGAYDQALETYKRALQANSSDRDLKHNYSRFLEFYQAYNPVEPSEADKAAEAQAEVLQADGNQTASTPSEQAPTEEAPTKEAPTKEAQSDDSDADGDQAENGQVDEPESAPESADTSGPPSSSGGQ
jgi:tetratricopeptide (TPR) repeat protein